MKLSAKNIIFFCCMIFCLVLLHFTKSVPVSRIWSDYQVLYTEVTADENLVLEILEQNGCKNVITGSRQKIPVNIDGFNSQNLINDSYLENRMLYFTDESRMFRLFYIPEEYNRNLEKALSFIQKNKLFNAGIDGKTKNFFFIPLVCLIVFIILCLSSEKPFVYTAVCLPFILFVISRPFFSSACSSILFMLSFFLALKFWKRKDSKRIILSSIFILVPFFFAILVNFVFSLINGLIYLSVTAAGFSIFMLCKSFENYRSSKNSFSYTLIIPAKLIPVVNKSNSKFILFTSGGIFILLVLFLLSGRIFTGSSKSNLSLPSPVKSNIYQSHVENFQDSSKIIPDINNFYSWAWKSVTFPYRKMSRPDLIQSIPKMNDQITMKNYAENNGAIEVTEKVLFEYNDDFFEQLDDEIESLPYASIENFMKKQKDEGQVVYSKNTGSSTQKNKLSLILIILCFFVPLILYFYYTVTGRKV